MSDDYLYSQLFSHPPPPQAEKKESNSDILNSLFEIDLPAPKKKEPEIKKNKNEDEINNYISSINKNKSVPSLPKQKQHYSNKIQPVPNKPSSSNSAKTSTPKPVERVAQRKEAKYMPTVVDIFAKKEDKSAKPKQTIQKRQTVKAKPEEPKSKVEAKREKIQLKEKEKNDKPKELKPAPPRPQIPEKTKKEAPKQRPVQKERPPKKRKQSSSSSSEDSSSSSEQSDGQNWRKMLRGVTGYNPNDKKFRERDHMRIIQSGVDRIFGQDKFSYKMGRREQEQDMRLQYLQKMKKLKKEHRH